MLGRKLEFSFFAMIVAKHRKLGPQLGGEGAKTEGIGHAWRLTGTFDVCTRALEFTSKAWHFYCS